MNLKIWKWFMFFWYLIETLVEKPVKKSVKKPTKKKAVKKRIVKPPPVRGNF